MASHDTAVQRAGQAFLLDLLALYERRSLHWTPSDLAQMVLGLCKPPLLANHPAKARFAFAEFGLNKGYARLLYSFWITSPFFGGVQLLLLVVVSRLDRRRDLPGCLQCGKQLRNRRCRSRHAMPHAIDTGQSMLGHAAPAEETRQKTVQSGIRRALL